VREFFAVIHNSACKRFKTVLSPDYNAAHYNHLHLDMGKRTVLRLGKIADRPKPAQMSNDTRVPPRLPPRQQEAENANTNSGTPQTEHPAYRLAFQDMDFLLREDLRPVRFQLELLKPQLILDEANIASTFVVYGSARIPEPEKAEGAARAGRPTTCRRRSPSG
jgi:hypothetical protein